MHTLQSKLLTVTVDAKGAELKSIRHKQHNLEYLWGANPAVWGKTSPVLFPIVGTLKQNAFRYKGQEYHLPRHGFARDKRFELTEQTTDSLTFTLKASADTFAVYPFSFAFSIRYRVANDALHAEYIVRNDGEEEMLFSVGGHPAFSLPLVNGTSYNDYFLRFEKTENAPRWPISKEGLIEEEPLPFLKDVRELPLSKGLFQKDAIVLKHLRSNWVELLSDKTPHGLRFSFEGFPYLGLWAAPGADFLCIEPWCGIADSVTASGELNEKEGIVVLGGGETFQRQWSMSFF